MYLKRLEVSGFKSFANKSTLEFNKGVSAVVGPNGSGKSNIADAMRWVMGEQGMKNLRSKKSEDLIFNGSNEKGAANKAHVTLVFDNSDRVFPMEFEEISITRKVFRDGENQYFINDAQTRLKDVLELIAKARLGLRGYTIINQGMGDFILSATPLQRREIFEDALGLKEFQLKKTDAQNKLALTRANLAQTQTLIAEIVPHLKFLKKQVEKIQQKEILENALKENEKKYFGARVAFLKKQKDNFVKEKEDVQRIFKEEEGFMNSLKENIEKIESELDGFFDQESILERELEDIVAKKSAIDRELGKIEGVLAYQKEVPKVVYEPVNLPYLNNIFKSVYQKIKSAASAGSFDEAKAQLDGILVDFEKVLAEIESGKIKKEPSAQPSQPQNIIDPNLISEKERLVGSLNDFDTQIKLIREKVKDLNNSHRAEKDKLYNLKRELYERESRHEKLKQQASNFDIQLNRINAEIELVKQESQIVEEAGDAPFETMLQMQSHELDALKNEIDRLRVRLEMMENIDPEIQKEYDETQKRYEFLTVQSEDLNKAIFSLDDVIVNLETKIEALFTEAFVKIDTEFNRYFNTLFEGGRANLVRLTAQKRQKSVDIEDDFSDAEEEAESEDGGIDIKVDMARKKVKDIHLLSGGERALTSIALIFALVSCSPPPFLMLDEIDAPLDESNALRLGRILEELRKKTQFVVITHNRETMKQADILYGITMGDDGVSKVFSIKLEEAKTI